MVVESKENATNVRFEQIFKFKPSRLPEVFVVEYIVVKSQLRDRAAKIQTLNAEISATQDKYQKIDDDWSTVDITEFTTDIEILKKSIFEVRGNTTAFHEAIDIAIALGFKDLPRGFVGYLSPGIEKPVGE